MDPDAQIRALRASFRRQTAPKRRGLQNQGGGDIGAGGLFNPGRSLEPRVDLELEEWFEAQKEIRVVAKLDPFFERTSKFASRRLKREIERRGTLVEFALEPDPSTKRIPTEESASDLFRSDWPDAVALSCQVESLSLESVDKAYQDAVQSLGI
jgi:hypothetical protein